MKYRKLGRTDLTVSVVALGCYPFEGGTTWGPQDERDSIATIESALEAGITFFDTAEAYGDGYSEKLLGRVLAGCRHEVVIATKVSPDHLSPERVQKACEASLRRLQTDYIDLYQIHWPSHTTPLAETIGALEQLQRQGMVRAIGVSNFGSGDLADFLAHGRCETNQLPYNLLWRAIEYEIVQECLEHDVSILTYSSLMQGLLTGKFTSAAEVPEGRARTRHYAPARPQVRHGGMGFEQETFTAINHLKRIAEQLSRPLAQVSLAWLLHQSGVASVLVGARNPQQIQLNIGAFDVDLSPHVLQELTMLTDELKAKLGADPDMWQSQSRYR